MRIAVTTHAVKRYQQRIDGAADFDEESIRTIIRGLVEEGFKTGSVHPHPTVEDRRIIPFSSGASILYLSIGPNATSFEADLAVIGVLFENELTNGKIGTGVTLGDIAPGLASFPTSKEKFPKYIVLIGDAETIETYKVKDDEELQALLSLREKGARAHVYQLKEAQ